MAIFLKKFETISQYNAYTADTENFILPNVSLTVDNSTVHYNPSSPVPPTPSYETVDLGLPSGTLWAKYNVGATSETEYGNYYQYGKGAAQYAATSGDSDYSGEEDPLAASADTAAQVWGGSWHMPTQAQLEELKSNTTFEFTTINGVNGGKLTAQNGNYIFVPAAGAYYDGVLDNVGDGATILSSTPCGGDAIAFSYNEGGTDVSDYSRRYGWSVRAVIG